MVSFMLNVCECVCVCMCLLLHILCSHVHVFFHCTFSLCQRVCMDVFSHPCTSSIPLISCISYGHSVLKPGVISCMLKTGVSKPVNFRPLLVGLFIFFWMWLSGMSSFSTELLCVLRLSAVFKARLLHTDIRGGQELHSKQPKCLFIWKQSLIVNTSPVCKQSNQS